MSPKAAFVTIVFVTVAFVFGLAAITVPLLRRLARTTYRGSRNRQPRIAIMDAADVDNRRRLLLIRRDNVEHLILVGGHNDVVVEQNIIRGVPVSSGLGRRSPLHDVSNQQDGSYEQAPKAADEGAIAASSLSPAASTNANTHQGLGEHRPYTPPKAMEPRTASAPLAKPEALKSVSPAAQNKPIPSAGVSKPPQKALDKQPPVRARAPIKSALTPPLSSLTNKATAPVGKAADTTKATTANPFLGKTSAALPNAPHHNAIARSQTKESPKLQTTGKDTGTARKAPPEKVIEKKVPNKTVGAALQKETA
ncbi:flagellar biosynthetic protein FliO [Flexibacterium corallicola]|uniref:flagellar biosynthetic protein FliO n=1 Tax=Flexibacterium corallicola TaxID=3037259 RepID=UPI00286FA814|nr:flagellar biosynthetic protein FliO [Pseudovibrio sp. M1P-2-3]